MRFSNKLKLCFEVMKTKHEKSLSVFVLGYRAGFKDGVNSERESAKLYSSFVVDERIK